MKNVRREQSSRRTFLDNNIKVKNIFTFLQADNWPLSLLQSLEFVFV